MVDLGNPISSHSLEKGLTELNGEISFDLTIRRPSDYSPMFKWDHSKMCGVYWKGRHICSMGRGMVPENDCWQTREDFEPIDMADIERYDDTKVIYIEILPTDPFYHAALSKAEAKDDNYKLDGDGRVFRYEAMRMGRVLDKIVMPGWRHTLERVASAGIPGVTTIEIEKKFGVKLSPS